MPESGPQLLSVGDFLSSSGTLPNQHVAELPTSGATVCVVRTRFTKRTMALGFVSGGAVHTLT